MEPTIMENDLIITKNCKEEEIHENDIIVFKRGDTIISHRIDKITSDNGKNYYITKGDNNYILDEQKVLYKDVEGKYVGKISKVGKIMTVLKNEKIVIAIIVVFLVINYLNCKRNKEKIIRQQQRRKYEGKH